MTLWTSPRVVAGTPAHAQAKRDAEAVRFKFPVTARVEWRDEYNDYSVAGVFAVVS